MRRPKYCLLLTKAVSGRRGLTTHVHRQNSNSITTITDNGPVAWRENLRLNYKHWKQVTDRNAAFMPTDHAVESEAKAESG